MRLKLKVTNKIDAGDQGVAYTLFPDYDAPENKEWSKWTPSAQMTFTVTNPACKDELALGDAVYVDVQVCERPAGTPV